MSTKTFHLWPRIAHGIHSLSVDSGFFSPHSVGCGELLGLFKEAIAFNIQISFVLTKRIHFALLYSYKYKKKTISQHFFPLFI